MNRWILPFLAICLCCCLATAKALAQEPLLTFDKLPAVIQKHVQEVRQSCKEMNSAEEVPDAMQGISTFYLTGERRLAVLVHDRSLCSQAYKGANCHTYGCDLSVYASAANGEWAKILDEPISGPLFLSVSVKSEFILAAVSVTGKYDKLCGGRSAQSPYCDFLLYWKRGQWAWQKLR
jgi:hypothetical protein